MPHSQNNTAAFPASRSLRIIRIRTYIRRRRVKLRSVRRSFLLALVCLYLLPLLLLLLYDHGCSIR